MGVDLGLADLKDLHAEYNDIGLWSGLRVASFTATATAAAAATPPAELVENQVLLATHKPLLDAGRCQEGEPYLAGTARLAIAQVSAGTAERVGLHQTGVLVTGPAGTVTLPLVIADMPDDVVWLPQCSQGSLVYSALGAAHGSVVTLSATEVK